MRSPRVARALPIASTFGLSVVVVAWDGDQGAGHRFEKRMQALYEDLGCEVEDVGYGGCDYGIDLIVRWGGQTIEETMAMQVKLYDWRAHRYVGNGTDARVVELPDGEFGLVASRRFMSEYEFVSPRSLNRPSATAVDEFEEPPRDLTGIDISYDARLIDEASRC